MRIYNQKGFWTGLFEITLAILSLCLCFYKGFTLLDVVLSFFLLFCGSYLIYRSFSRSRSDADQDERTKLVSMKARSAAFLWSIGFCFLNAVIQLVVYQSKRTEVSLTLFLCFLLTPLLMLFINLITEAYYDRKL